MRKVSLVLLLVLLATGSRGVGARSEFTDETCKVGQQAASIGFWTWPANTKVRVYVRVADFTDPQLTSLQTALQNWNLTAEQTGSGVKFDYQGNTTERLDCAGCLTILRGRVFDQKSRHATELRAYSAYNDQLITSAAILVDPVLTNSEAILNAMVHELGHNLGLLDCYTCKRRSTVMNQFAAINSPNDMERPTACDVAQVRQVYQNLSRVVRVSFLARAATPVDEGEEPEDDDTPIVIPPPRRR